MAKYEARLVCDGKDCQRSCNDGLDVEFDTIEACEDAIKQFGTPPEILNDPFGEGRCTTGYVVREVPEKFRSEPEAVVPSNPVDDLVGLLELLAALGAPEKRIRTIDESSIQDPKQGAFCTLEMDVKTCRALKRWLGAVPDTETLEANKDYRVNIPYGLDTEEKKILRDLYNNLCDGLGDRA